MKTIAKILLATVSTCLLGAPIAFSQIQAPGPTGQIFLDDFNSYAIQTGNPPPDYYVNGKVTSKGVSGGGVSGNAGFFGIDLATTGGFGGALNDTLEGNSLNFTGATLSISVMSSAGPSVEGYFSLRIVDGAGNGARSPFYNPTAVFTTFAPAFSTFIGNGGTGTPNMKDIEEIDVIAYNLGDNIATTLTIDDLQATVVPEPSALVGVLLLGCGLFVVYRCVQHSTSSGIIS